MSLHTLPNQSLAKSRISGLTIIQLMLVLLIAGVLGSVAVNYIIDKRCENVPALSLCKNR